MNGRCLDPLASIHLCIILLSFTRPLGPLDPGVLNQGPAHKLLLGQGHGGGPPAPQLDGATAVAGSEDIARRGGQGTRIAHGRQVAAVCEARQVVQAHAAVVVVRCQQQWPLRAVDRPADCQHAAPVLRLHVQQTLSQAQELQGDHGYQCLQSVLPLHIHHHCSCHTLMTTERDSSRLLLTTVFPLLKQAIDG